MKYHSLFFCFLCVPATLVSMNSENNPVADPEVSVIGLSGKKLFCVKAESGERPVSTLLSPDHLAPENLGDLQGSSIFQLKPVRIQCGGNNSFGTVRVSGSPLTSLSNQSRTTDSGAGSVDSMAGNCDTHDEAVADDSGRGSK